MWNATTSSASAPAPTTRATLGHPSRDGREASRIRCHQPATDAVTTAETMLARTAPRTVPIRSEAGAEDGRGGGGDGAGDQLGEGELAGRCFWVDSGITIQTSGRGQGFPGTTT